MRRALGLAVSFSLLLWTSCALNVSLFMPNLPQRTLHVQYTVPCKPDCPSPTLISVRMLRHDGTDVHGHRPAPADVRGRVDSLVTYSLDLAPDTAVRMFDGWTDFSGDMPNFPVPFPHVRIVVDTGQAVHVYEGAALADAFRKWHKLVHVLEAQ